MVAYRFRCRAASATTFHALTQLLDTLSRGTADLSSPDRSRSDGPNLYPPTLLSILPSTHPSTHLSTHVYGGPTMCQEGRKQLSLRHSPQLKSLSPPLSLPLSHTHTRTQVSGLTHTRAACSLAGFCHHFSHIHITTEGPSIGEESPWLTMLPDFTREVRPLLPSICPP